MFKKARKTLHAGVVLVLMFVFGWGTVSPVNAASTIRRVKWDAAGSNNGTSWANAYTSLRSAIAASSSGDQIWVAAGTYTPTTETDRSISFVLKNGVSIYGGFTGTETQLSQRSLGPSSTILSGDIGVTGDNSDNSYHVVVSNNVNSTAKLDGFTITQGNANGGSYPFSGGGLLNRYGSSPTLTGLVFTENTAYDSGGGLASLDDGSPQLTNVKFIQNTAIGGGGMYSQGGKPVVTNAVFDSNQANTGGGLLTSTDSAVLMNVEFSNNEADRDGGGIANLHGSPTLTNVTFSGNIANRTGGGMFTDYYSEPVLKNVTFADNTAGFRAGGLSLTTKSNATIINAIFWGNTATESSEIFVFDSKPSISTSIVQGGCPSGMTCSGITIKSPQLGDLDDYGGFSRTMALFDGSPAIDKGDDDNCPDTDQRGVERPQNNRCDIGAFEAGTPGVPNLVSPPNDAQVISLLPRLDWVPTNPDVDHYQIQVAASNTFSAPVVNESDVVPSVYTLVDELQPGQRYYWRVRAINDNGDISGWSRVLSFRTPLEAAMLISPADGESFLVTSATFEWDTVAKAEQYILQVSGSSTFGTLLVNTTLTTTTYTARSLPKDQTIYWRVRGKNSFALGLWSEKWSFHTGNPPSVPDLVSPAKDALVRDYTPRLDWTDSTVPASATFKQYELQVDDNNNFSSPDIETTLSDITASEFTPSSDLASETKYFWRVRAVSIYNAEDHVSAWSSVSSFRTAIEPPTSLAVVPNPANALRPIFDWDDSTGIGVTGYVIQVSNRADFSNLLVNSNVVNSTYKMTNNLPAGKTIYWRVRVKATMGPSEWSTEQFMTP